MKWIVCQIGAREHYAVARALHRRGELAALVTDLWVPPGSWVGKLPGMRRLKERWHAELADARVLAPNLAMLGFESWAKRPGKRARGSNWPLNMARNAFFQRRALDLLSTLNAHPSTLFSYSYAAGELFRAAKKRGWRTVLGQIDPGPEEERIVADVSRRHGVDFQPAPHDYWHSWRRETELADRIVVNSTWSKDCLRKEGIPEGKIVVVPLAYEADGKRLKCEETKRPKDEETKRRLKEVTSEGLRVTGGGMEDGGRRSEIGVQISEVRGQKTGFSVGEETEVRGDEWRVKSGEWRVSRNPRSEAGGAKVEKFESGKVGKFEGEVAGEESSVASGGMVERRDEETKRQPSLRTADSPKANRLPSNQLTKDQRPETGEREYPERFTKERPMRVLFLGQINVRKGVLELLEAARLVENEPVEFLLVGGVPDGLFLGKVPPNVRLMGRVERGEAQRWYSEADVFVLPTHSDGFALTQLEAQARGLPVIASRHCGEVVRDGVNGVLLPEVTAAALADALRSLAADPPHLASMAAESKRESGFSLEAIGRMLVAA
jgi:glycosyltransferase involved in cell wall biosynthesis